MSFILKQNGNVILLNSGAVNTTDSEEVFTASTPVSSVRISFTDIIRTLFSGLLNVLLLLYS